MLLDTLKLLAFKDMDVQIRKFLDCIFIINEKKEFITRDGKAMFKVTSIDTELSFDGELLSSRISEIFLPNETIESIPWMYYNYPSYDYFNRVPLNVVRQSKNLWKYVIVIFLHWILGKLLILIDLVK